MVDKKLVSVNPLTYNVGLRDENTSVVTGKVLNVGLTRNFTMVTVQFAYYDDQGAEIARSAWTIEGETEINALWAQVEPLMPPPTTYAQDTLLKYYVGFMLIAAEAWGVPTTDFVLVDDV
jgi:hypothetical protein